MKHVIVLLFLFPVAAPGYAQVDELTPNIPDSVYLDMELLPEQKYFEDGHVDRYEKPVTLLGRNGYGISGGGQEYAPFGVWNWDRHAIYSPHLDYGTGSDIVDILHISTNGFRDGTGHLFISFLRDNTYEKAEWDNFVRTGYIIIGTDTMRFSDGIVNPGTREFDNKKTPECALNRRGGSADPFICWPDMPLVMQEHEFVNVTLVAKPFLPVPTRPGSLTVWQHRSATGARVPGAVWLSWRIPVDNNEPLEQLRIEKEQGIHYEYRVLRDGDKELKTIPIEDTRIGTIDEVSTLNRVLRYQRRTYLVTGLDRNGEYSFCIRAVNATGPSEETCNPEAITPVYAEHNELPEGLALSPNYPNPFNPATIIAYHTPTEGAVHLEVFDMTGRLVVALVDGYRPTGAHTVRFDANELPSGTYIYRLSTSTGTISRMLAVTK